MKRIRKKILPVFLTVILLFTLAPTQALASGPDISIEDTTSVDGGANTPADTSTTPPSCLEPDISITPNGEPEPDGDLGDIPSTDVDGNADPGLDGAGVALEDAGISPMDLMGIQATGTLSVTHVPEYPWDFSMGIGAPDMVPWYIMDIDGKIAYCVEPLNPVTYPGSYQTLDYYAELTRNQRLAVGYAMLYGAQDAANPLFHMATQTVIWEICLGYLDLTTLTTVNKSAYNCTIGHNPGAAGYYDQIIASMRSHAQVPSFTRFVEAFAPLHKMPGVTGEYKLDLVNTNPDCDLANFVFADSGTVSFVKEGQILHVTSTTPLDGSTTYIGVKGSMDALDSMVFWCSGADQIRATGHTDPVTAFFRLTTEDIGAYSITIEKHQTGTNLPLAGAEFEVRHAEKGVVGTFTTDGSGSITVPVPWQGAYIVTEITPPAGHLLSGEPMKDVVISTGKPGTSVSFHNDPFSGIQITKVDAATKARIPGVTFRIAYNAGNQYTDITTGPSGIAALPGLEPGWYTIQEISCPPGYILDAQVCIIELKSGEVAAVTIENHAKPSLEIRKVDALTGEALAGAIFRIADNGGLATTDITTGADGIARLPGLEPGHYTVTEILAPKGYILDGTPQVVEIVEGRATTIVLKNTPLPGLMIQKVDSVTGLGMAGVAFEVEKISGERIGSFVSDAGGYIFIPNITEEEYVIVREVETLPGYRIDTAEKLVKLEKGKLNRVVFENSPYPYLVILKIDEGTKAPLPGTVFKLMDADGSEIGSYTTNQQGRIVLTGLDAGAYKLQEVQAAEGYVLDDRVWNITLAWGKTTTVTFKNIPLTIKVEVEKRGPVEAIAGQEIQYDFRSIANHSTVALEEFYWHDILPTDAVRLVSIRTGTWSQDFEYSVVYRTNLKDNWAVLRDGLLTSVDHILECSPQVLGLASNEYLTEFKFLFGTVQPGFREVKHPFITCRVLADLPDSYQFTNRTDVGGRYGGKWTYDKDFWTTVVYKTPDRGTLPKTGAWV